MQLKKSLVAVAIVAALMSSAAVAQEMKRIAIGTIVEVPALVDVKNGILKGLEEKGFVVGTNLEVDYQNANGNMPTQQQIAKKFVGDNVDLIVAITTPTAQAMAAVTSDIPIIFAAVTDPVKAKLIPQFEKPGGNITGASDAAPFGQQVDLIKEMVPNLKTLGFIYNPGLDNAVSDLANIKIEAERLGIDVMESPSPTTNEVIIAARRMVGKVEAVYIPNDTTVVSALEAVLKVCQDGKIACFTGETGGVERGAIAAVGFDYFEGGRISGRMAGDVLLGANPGDIDAVPVAKVLEQFIIYVNKTSADAIGLEIPASVTDRATQIFE